MRWSAALALAVALASAGCGTAQPQISETDLALEACMQEAGYGPELLRAMPVGEKPLGSVYADPAFDRALSRCIVVSGAGTADGDDPEEVAAQNQRAMQFTACMRDLGWSVPDPRTVKGPGGTQYLVPAIEGPGSANAAIRSSFDRDVATCGAQSGIPVLGAPEEVP